MLKKIIRNIPQNKFLAVAEGLTAFYSNAKRRYERDKDLRPDKSGGQYLSVVAVVKNEAPYIAEWIEYHLLAGVEKFYIYDNESDDNIKEILEPYIKEGIVEYIFWHGKGQQIIVYNDAVERFRYNSFWLAFIDIDEFIVPISTKTIPEFLKDFEDVCGIEINWIMYGDSGHKTKTEGLVIERFKDHSEDDFAENRQVKTILNPRHVLCMQVHHACYVKQTSVNSDKNKNKKYFPNRKPLFNKIRINHYFTKSYEEFLAKQAKGRVAPSFADKKLGDEYYHVNDERNIVKNDGIMDKYIPLVKQNIAKRFAK